jgi:hypothetical protein
VHGVWKEIVVLWFQGKRFQEPAVEISALGELSQFQKIVSTTAEELWRAANPTRKNLPKHFEDRTRLYLRGEIRKGRSAGLCLAIPVKPRAKNLTPDLFEKELEEVKNAVECIEQVYESQEREKPLPVSLSQELLGEYTKFGQSLLENEAIELAPAWTSKKQPAKVTHRTRERLTRFIESKYEDHVDITGEVTAASVRQNRFELLLDDESRVEVNFTPEQEEQVTEALHRHRTIRIRVKGTGKRTPQGKLENIEEVTDLNLQPVGEIPYDETARPIEEILMEMANEIPEEERKKLPPDLSENLDHYLYGTPKK